MKYSLPNPPLLGLAISFGFFSFAAPDQADAQTILYICGDEKGDAGIAFDHGLINYIQSEFGGSTVTPTLSSDMGISSIQGLYDPDDPSVAQTYDFDTFDCIVMSSTVSTHYLTQLMTDLNATSTNLLLMSEESLFELHMVENAASIATTDSAFIGGAVQTVTNYPGNSLLSYGDNYWPEADVFASKDAASNATGTNGLYFSYDQGDVVDSGIDEFTMAGERVFLGLSEGDGAGGSPSGVWEDLNAPNGIVDVDEEFNPDIHLTTAGKTMLDSALGLHVVPEAGTTTLCLLTALLFASRRRRQS